MRRDRKHWGTDGFTLSEMLVVLAILALTAALSLPVTRQSVATQDFNSFSRSLAGLLREARLQAVSRNRETAVTFDFNQRVATFVGKQNENVLRRISIPETVTIAAVTARGDVSSESVTFRFFADGGATGGQIQLTSGSLARSIEINWLTGNISLLDGSRP
jgi:general secretion pathway protein H